MVPERRLPSFRPFSPEYVRVVLNRHELKTVRTSHRILIGVNDEILGDGWSRLTGDFPRHRRMGHAALCFLENQANFEYLQIHGLWDSSKDQPWLEVAIDRKTIGRQRVEIGWHTYIFPFDNQFGEGLVEVKVQVSPPSQCPPSERGFAVNEIGLFPLGSPILRWME